MRKASFFAVIMILLASACTKKNGESYGSYTFKSQTYTIGFADWVLGYFVGNTVNNFPTGSIALSFRDTHDPSTSIEWTIPKNSTYPVTSVDPPSDSGYVFIRLTDTSATHAFKPVLHPTGQVTVTKDADGRNMTVTITAVQMVRDGDPSDTALLNGSFRQSR